MMAMAPPPPAPGTCPALDRILDALWTRYGPPRSAADALLWDQASGAIGVLRERIEASDKRGAAEYVSGLEQAARATCPRCLRGSPVTVDEAGSGARYHAGSDLPCEADLIRALLPPELRDAPLRGRK